MSIDSAAWMVDAPGDKQYPDGVPHAASSPGVHGSMFRATGDFHSRPQGWVDGLGEHLFVLGNLSTRNLVGSNKAYADSDILDLGPDSLFFNTPTAQLHASMWMMAKSPLMYGGQLPIEDATTLNLVTNPLALLINSHSSSNMLVKYQGNCSCRPKSGYACKPHNTEGEAPCVATWWSSLGPKCKAVAVLNVGAVAAPSVEVQFSEIGYNNAQSPLPSIVDVYANTSKSTSHPSFNVEVQGMGGVLLIVHPETLDSPAECIGG
jgi:hypothetical protein